MRVINKNNVFLDRHTNSQVSPSTFATKLLEAGVTLTCSTVGYLAVTMIETI